ncbi:MAG: hypothetical protein DMG30_19690 [Acidobacteria bacterium]|nr:MAG: hypothetical protein DMG30_19690 [Acidobacteriota bacterium]
MLRPTLLITVMVALVAFPILNTPVVAHHGTALWSANEITLKGTVVEYVWRNPHALVIWDVKDDKGNVVQWTGELASPETLMGDGGMTKNSVIDQIKRADGTMVLRWSRQAGGTDEERAARDRAREARDAEGNKAKN